MFFQTNMPALEKLTLFNCKMSEKAVEYISKKKCENLK